MGRPSKYTDAVIDQIVERLSTGEPLAQICRDEGMPAYRTVKDWMDEVDSTGVQTERGQRVSAAIARAREEGEEALAAECLEIADDARNDWMERAAEKGDEKAMQFNGEHVQRSKLRIDTRLKLLAKFNPKRWGDRVDLNHGGTVNSNLTVSFVGAAQQEPEVDPVP